MKDTTKKILLALTSYAFVMLTGVVLYKIVGQFYETDFTSLIFRTYLSIVFFIFIRIFILEKNIHFRSKESILKYLIPISLIFVLFIINNVLIVLFSNSFSNSYLDTLPLVIIGFIANSFFEELAYRGFLQAYINQNDKENTNIISKGNLIATIIMTITHLGFYQVSDFLFATSSLLLVVVLSLTLGYLYDKGISLWKLIIIHTLINLVHLVIIISPNYL